MSTATLAPYGLRHQVQLPEVYTAPMPDVSYDPGLQLNFHHRVGVDGRLDDPWSEPVAPIAEALRPWLDEAGPADATGRLLE